MSAKYIGSKGDVARQWRTQERFHFGAKDLTLGLSLSKDLINLESLGSVPTSNLPKILNVWEMAALYPFIVEGDKFLSRNRYRKKSAKSWTVASVGTQPRPYAHLEKILHLALYSLEEDCLLGSAILSDTAFENLARLMAFLTMAMREDEVVPKLRDTFLDEAVLEASATVAALVENPR